MFSWGNIKALKDRGYQISMRAIITFIVMVNSYVRLNLNIGAVSQMCLK